METVGNEDESCGDDALWASATLEAVCSSSSGASGWGVAGGEWIVGLLAVASVAVVGGGRRSAKPSKLSSCVNRAVGNDVAPFTAAVPRRAAPVVAGGGGGD